ncbi:MAG TPA: protease pro-enzyme activation domain-containing protein [Solirubrobacteraceae bacterium]
MGSSASAHAADRATVALAPHDPAGLAAYATAVTARGSPAYGRYLTVAQFARRFGARPAAVTVVRRGLAAHGLRAGAISANGLTLAITATAPVAHRAFATAAGGRDVAAPAIAGRVAGLVQAVIGSGASAPTASVIVPGAAAHAFDVTAATVAPATPAAGPQPCPIARAAGGGGAGYTADRIASAYGLSGYYGAGDEGAGVTIALYELEPFSAADVAAYQSCYGTTADVRTIPIDGGAGAGAGSGEAAMDIETAIGLAPRATINVYEGPATGLGAYDTYSRIVADDSAQVISTSWGQCEALEGAVPAAAEQTLFEEAAVQGQSLVASAGDQGSDDCGDRRPSVDDPASQPWVTGVGATSLQTTGDLVWNDSLGASGGGASRLWGRPAYQNQLALPQSGVTCGAAGTACREVPDLSIDGDPATGYVAYYLGAWRLVGGSSVAAPAIAALTALADASPACAGHRIGFLNPDLYRAAAANYAANFHDVTAGTNGFDSVAGFAADPGYDMASGLGTPGASLGPTLCRDAVSGASRASTGSTAHGPQAVSASSAVRLGRSRNRTGLVGVAVHVRVAAHDPQGGRLTYTATGLPRGLRLSARTGRISGRPRRVGSTIVRLRVSDDRGGSATTMFRWRIAARRFTG